FLVTVDVTVPVNSGCIFCHISWTIVVILHGPMDFVLLLLFSRWIEVDQERDCKEISNIFSQDIAFAITSCYILFEQGGPKEDLCMIAFYPQGVSVWERAEAVHLQAEETKLEYLRNIVTNSRETPSWREIVSLTVLVKLASFTISNDQEIKAKSRFPIRRLEKAISFEGELINEETPAPPNSLERSPFTDPNSSVFDNKTFNKDESSVDEEETSNLDDFHGRGKSMDKGKNYHYMRRVEEEILRSIKMLEGKIRHLAQVIQERIIGVITKGKTRLFLYRDLEGEFDQEYEVLQGLSMWDDQDNEVEDEFEISKSIRHKGVPENTEYRPTKAHTTHIDARKEWSGKLGDALWAFRTAYKMPLEMSRFRVVYGLSATGDEESVDLRILCMLFVSMFKSKNVSHAYFSCGDLKFGQAYDSVCTMTDPLRDQKI
nr:hypothetical protein [Tanacetum cinerariifolium]